MYAPLIITTAVRINETPTAFWGEPIHVYTRAQAIADGVLVDAQVGDLQQVSRQHFGDTPVAMTAALFALIEKAVNNPKYRNDYRGVWHDICWMSRVTPSRAREVVYFKVIIAGTGRKRLHLLKRVMTLGESGPEVTFMLPDED